MRKVGIKTLKNKLSEYIRAAAAGETILVTDRDRVVAQMSAPPPANSTGDAWWEEQIRKGNITPARDRNAPMPQTRPLMKLDDILRDLDADRDDR
ncbi:MAG: type II toxin-antitoxin system Phd/YefM family antitoxin [Parvularculaceae bacterium]